MVLAELGVGAYFGERALLKNQTRFAGIRHGHTQRSVHYCTHTLSELHVGCHGALQTHTQCTRLPPHARRAPSLGALLTDSVNRVWRRCPRRAQRAMSVTVCYCLLLSVTVTT